MNPAHPTQTSRKEHHRMLQVSLAPTPIPLRILNHPLRRFFVASLQLAGKPDLPVFLHQQCRFDEVVAEDLAAERPGAWQMGQVTKLHERLASYDGVVTPIIAHALRPKIQATDEDWAVQAIRELLNSTEQ